MIIIIIKYKSKKEVIAFANCNGGKLYIGIQDNGTVSGLNDPDGAALQISNMVRDAIKPDLTMFLHYERRYGRKAFYRNHPEYF